jgi:hypothetical protein
MLKKLKQSAMSGNTKKNNIKAMLRWAMGNEKRYAALFNAEQKKLEQSAMSGNKKKNKIKAMLRWAMCNEKRYAALFKGEQSNTVQCQENNTIQQY